MTENIQWLFFDMGSTLIDESKAIKHRIDDAISGSTVTYDEFSAKMTENYKRTPLAISATAAEYGLKISKWHSEDEFLYPDTIDCLKTLSERYKIGIIANQDVGSETRLENFGIRKFIGVLAASAEDGVAKPDKRLFEIALKRARCKPENAVMIGDRPDNDIAPAKSLGMTAIWIKQGYSAHYVPQNKLEIPDYTVNNLTELVSLLGGNK